ncbi:Synaptotagmin-3 [Morella rubra]|uniref:Synaptotagmin-3 n=1 Tax=Morella rubra TaxID=262757 RepID=A0A6A1WEV7_9ROSI|nr:Synaptotagmin-3 [Morella rubra]
MDMPLLVATRLASGFLEITKKKNRKKESNCTVSNAWKYMAHNYHPTSFLAAEVPFSQVDPLLYSLATSSTWANLIGYTHKKIQGLSAIATFLTRLSTRCVSDVNFLLSFSDRMGFVGSLLGIIGFGIGIPLGLLLGFFLFIYIKPGDVKDPIIRPLPEFDTSSLLDILPEIPLWVKHPDYDRIDWLNKSISDMWPYLNKAICGIIKSTMEPMFANYIGKFQIKSVEFKSLSLGTLPPTIQGKYTSKKIKFSANLICYVIVFEFLMSQVMVDIQIFAAPRIVLKPLVPTFPCFGSIMVSLMEKDAIRKQVASLYLWPQTFEIPVLDGSVGAMKKPVGILRVKVIRALKLLKKDLLGTSDPYVKLSLSGDGLPAKRTSIKMKNLNPEWNEDFRLTVKDPESQVLQLHVYDWEKVGRHDKLGMQVVPLRLVIPNETKGFTLNLVKNTNPNDPQNKKWRGELVVELTFKPFRDDNERFSGPLNGNGTKENIVGNASEDASNGAGLLLVIVQGAEDVEGKHQSNPYALVTLGGEQKKTQVIKNTRDPSWNEEFQFVLEEAPLKEKIHIEVISKRKCFGFRKKESLGYVDINLNDVVYNGRINEKYNLINSRNGVIHVEIRWKMI